MGLLDDVQSTINRGVAATGRTARVAKLRTQMSEAMKRRQALAAQLGASLYEETKDNPEFGRRGSGGAVGDVPVLRDAHGGDRSVLQRLRQVHGRCPSGARADAVHCPCGSWGTGVPPMRLCGG